MGPRCSFCGASTGPFLEVEGLFTVLMCVGCQAARSSSPRPGLPTNRGEMGTRGPDQPAELLVRPDFGKPWLQWGCPLAGCDHRVVLPWELGEHAAAEHLGWTATFHAEEMRVVYRRAAGQGLGEG